MMRIPFVFLLMTLGTVLAGPGHDHGPALEGAGPSGPVTLSESQRRNLGLQVVEAQVTEMSASVEVPATLVVAPERHGRVSAPFEGRVVEVLVKLGQDIKAGTPVLKVAPLAVGAPPQVLTTPVDGHVIRQNSMPGMTFTPTTALLEVGEDSELLAQGIFFQSPALRQLKMGAPAYLSVDLFPGERFKGTVQRLDTGHGPEDPSFHIYAVIPNGEGRLRPNFRGRLTIELSEPQSVVAVPRRALLGSLGKLFVFVENDDHLFEKREVVAGLRSGELVEIVEGLLPGEKVVTVGNYQLQYMSPEKAAPTQEAHHH